MKILVIGSGGREHAVIGKLLQNTRVEKVYCAPGNAGIAKIAELVAIEVTETEKLTAFAKENAIDLTVVGTETPLVMGIVNLFHEKGLRIFGPTQAAAMLEGSKAFSKDFMKKYNIPTADYQIFDDYKKALAYARQSKYPLVVKADGLAAGKGVLICQNSGEAERAIHQMIEEAVFAEAGHTIVIEEFLEGREVSVLAFCDGKTVLPMESARDYKRAYDGDKGLNTGGMGTVSPCETYTAQMQQDCMEQIFKPTMQGMLNEGIPYQGILYFGLMATKNGVKVVEYNARFGDPETQVVLPRLKSDLLGLLEACIDGTLHEQPPLTWHADAAVCVILASGGYPGHYKTGLAITGLDKVAPDAHVFHAGTVMRSNVCVTSGGRVLGVTGLGKTTQDAADTAYINAEKIVFSGRYFRKDIGRN